MIVIGETLVRIRELEPGVFGQIDEAEKAIGLRNLLVHGYDAVDAGAVYRASQGPVREMVQRAKALSAL